MNVKFLMKFLPMVLVSNTFFCMQSLTAMDTEDMGTEGERLLIGRLLETIGPKQNEQRIEESETTVERVPLNESLKELMQCLSGASDNAKAGLFAKIARNEYKLVGKKLTLSIIFNTIDAAKYYAKNPTNRPHVEKLFSFIKSHDCYNHYSNDVKKLIEDKREEILEKFYFD